MSCGRVGLFKGKDGGRTGFSNQVNRPRDCNFKDALNDIFISEFWCVAIRNQLYICLLSSFKMIQTVKKTVSASQLERQL